MIEEPILRYLDRGLPWPTSHLGPVYWRSSKKDWSHFFKGWVVAINGAHVPIQSVEDYLKE